MSTFFDLYTELENFARKSQETCDKTDPNGSLLKTDSLDCLKDHKIGISGFAFQNFLTKDDNIGDLVNGFSMRNIKTSVQRFNENMQKLGIRYKVVLSGEIVFPDKEYWNKHTNLVSSLISAIWKLEFLQNLYYHKKNKDEANRAVKKISDIKSKVKSSYLYKYTVYNYLKVHISDILKEEKIESLMAPNREENQMAWMQSYDYCDALWGDFSLLAYNEKVNSLVIDLNFKAETFEYIDVKEYLSALGLNDRKNCRFLELLSFYTGHNADKESYDLINILNDDVKNIENNFAEYEERSAKLLTDRCKIIKDATDSMPSNYKDDDVWKKLETLGENGINVENKEKIWHFIDYGQIINSNCDLLRFPNYLGIDKRNVKNHREFGYDFTKNGDLYAILCFEIQNPLLLQLCSKCCEFSFRLPVPICESQENYQFVEKNLKSTVDFSLGQLQKRFSKIFRMNKFKLEYVNFEKPLDLDTKTHLNDREIRPLHYFTEEAFAEYEKINVAPSEKESKEVLSLKKCCTMFFQATNSQTEDSPLKISDISQKEDVYSFYNMNDSEVLSSVYLTLFEYLEYISIEKKKFFILGAGLMRKVQPQNESNMIIIFELLRGLKLTNSFMNPLETSMLRSSEKLNVKDEYIVQSFRKTSEEIRKQPYEVSEIEKLASPDRIKASDSDKLHLDASRFDLKDSVLPTSSELEKTLNVIYNEMESAKQIFSEITSATKKKKAENITLNFINQGMYGKDINKILLISRIFTFVSGTQSSNCESSKYDKLVDYESNQFLELAKNMQLSLRLRCEGMLYNFVMASNSCKVSLSNEYSYKQAAGWSLDQMDGLKDKLPFRNLFSCHYAILIKIILTRYLILDETKKISNQIYKKISNSFNIKKIMAEFSCQGKE